MGGDAITPKVPRHDAEVFFQEKLADVDEPTTPFEVLDVRAQGSQNEFSDVLEMDLAHRLHTQARLLGLSTSTLFHAAWSLVVARTSGRDDIVFGSVLPAGTHSSAGPPHLPNTFINTLPLRLKLCDVTPRDLVEKTQRELLGLRAHENASIALVQRCSGLPESTPLFSAALQYRSSFPTNAGYHGVTSPLVIAGQQRANWPIVLSVDDLSEECVITAYTDQRIDAKRVSQYMCTALHSLVQALEQASQTPALSLSILPKSEYETIIERFNASRACLPQERLIHQLFEAQVERTPHAVAAIYRDQSLTYIELNQKANQLAHYLRDKGVSADQLVGLCIERSLEMVVGVLGILKAGGAYVPLDPGYPAERLSYMVDDAAPKVVLIQDGLQERLTLTRTQVVAIDRDWSSIACQPATPVDAPAIDLQPHHLAYVIYTSGSTGQPKGVMIEHRQVINLWTGLKNAYHELGRWRTIALNASVNFDASVQQFLQLGSGCTLVVLPEDVRRDPGRMLALIERYRIDGIDCTPAQLKAWVASGFFRRPGHKLLTVLVGGEAIDPELWRCLADDKETDFYNVYGPTECTVDATLAHLNGDMSSPHIGRPMLNRRIYILDSLGDPVPIGVTGEIHIGGLGVGRGYLNRPELTAKRFLRDPFSDIPSGKMYRTGDLGRWRADGTIEYLGRNDHQVKIRGFRIELGEIEAQLIRHSRVKEAVVLAREDKPGEKCLVAYVVAKGASAEIITGAGHSDLTLEPTSTSSASETFKDTIERVRALRPTRVLEIGRAEESLAKHLEPIYLVHRTAAHLQDLENGSFDTLIFNSVIQQFPDLEYVLSVLRQSVCLLRQYGKIFIADVLHLGLLPVLHSTLQLMKAPATINVAQLRTRIARATAEDRRLAIHPRFFELLPAYMPGITTAEVQLRRDHTRTGLARYHYDVVLHTDPDSAHRAICNPVHWRTLIDSSAEFEDALVERRWPAVSISAIPNSWLESEIQTKHLIETGDEHLEIGTLQAELHNPRRLGLDPEQFWRWGEALGYEVQVNWHSGGSRGEFDTQLLDRTRCDQIVWTEPQPTKVRHPLHAFINSPLDADLTPRLAPQLRDHLKETLPEHMIPSRWVMITQMPLTQNGKVDRGALPKPDELPKNVGEYVAPRTQLEHVLVDIWKQVLDVDHLGVRDNFLELGGHSLHAMKMVAKTAQRLAVELSVVDVLQFPTVARMATLIETYQSTPKGPTADIAHYDEGVI